MRGYGVHNFDQYHARRNSPEWHTYLLDRQTALQEFAQSHNDQVSARDSCGPQVVAAWDQCFRQVREPGVPHCHFCEHAPLRCLFVGPDTMTRDYAQCPT